MFFYLSDMIEEDANQNDGELGEDQPMDMAIEGMLLHQGRMSLYNK